MAIGKEIGKYLDEGLGINEIIMKHIHDIDSSCGISNPAYTKSSWLNYIQAQGKNMNQ